MALKSQESVRAKASALVKSLRPPHFATLASMIQHRFEQGSSKDRLEICRLLDFVHPVVQWQGEQLDETTL